MLKNKDTPSEDFSVPEAQPAFPVTTFLPAGGKKVVGLLTEAGSWAFPEMSPICNAEVPAGASPGTIPVRGPIQ